MEKLMPEQLLNKYILYCDPDIRYKVFIKVKKTAPRINGICLQGPEFVLDDDILSFNEFGSVTFSEWECKKLHIIDDPDEYVKEFCNSVLKKF